MQQAASELDQDRETRLQAVARKEAEELKAEEAARARSNKHGGRGEFVSGINRRIGDLGVADRIQRGHAGYEKDVED